MRRLPGTGQAQRVGLDAAGAQEIEDARGAAAMRKLFRALRA